MNGASKREAFTKKSDYVVVVVPNLNRTTEGIDREHFAKTKRIGLRIAYPSKLISVRVIPLENFIMTRLDS